METRDLHLMTGWIAMLLGVVVGAMIGLLFHDDNWAGGYQSWRRRMMRLGHISLFGIGFINLMFGLTLRAVTVPDSHAGVASVAFVIGMIAMPLCCFLAAWRKPFRHFFPVPVVSILVGIVTLLLGWSRT
ncbi:hypothetical protein DRQ53_10005 [bacterium]|nr:MAG: hypothetical protein DRQ32_01195 [bacterium]RKZ15077.1 MAG: hypothetical protein DRQ53_10005 [bacterium]